MIDPPINAMITTNIILSMPGGASPGYLLQKLYTKNIYKAIKYFYITIKQEVINDV